VSRDVANDDDEEGEKTAADNAAGWLELDGWMDGWMNQSINRSHALTHSLTRRWMQQRGVHSAAPRCTANASQRAPPRGKDTLPDPANW